MIWEPNQAGVEELVKMFNESLSHNNEKQFEIFEVIIF
jgi:hypothetical protein